MLNSQLRRKTHEVHLDLTPLIDVVFLLLIFFMVSTSFEKTHWLDLQLPAIDKEHQQADSDPAQVVIGIDAKGDFIINEKNVGALDANALKQQLQALLTSESIVIIQGDQSAPHGKVMQLLDTLGQLKVTQVHMAGVQE